MHPFIEQVERRHPPKKQQMCSTAPALFVFSLGFKFQFETLTGGKAEQVVDLMETSIKRVLRSVFTGSAHGSAGQGHCCNQIAVAMRCTLEKKA